MVDASFEVTPDRTFWVGFQSDCQAEYVDHPTVGFGALKSVHWHSGEPVSDCRLLGQWRGLWDVVGDMLDRGEFTEQEALGYMTGKHVGWTSGTEDLLFRGNVMPPLA